MHFLGVLQFTHVQPLPWPNKQLWTRVSGISSEFQLFIVGEGELQEHFVKDALFYEGTQKLQKVMNITTFVHNCTLTLSLCIPSGFHCTKC